ncbi:MAG: hypothetical protein U1E05_22285, partial [Patescibacteria group bacterium]|nr:hypothetical protein [Patescibacteria group bacterium]
MDRHEIIRFRPVLACLLGSLAISGVWLAQHTGDSAAVPRGVEGGAGTPHPLPVVARGALEPAASPTARPRLFLARDRVRRLPPVAGDVQPAMSVAASEQIEPAAPSGPVLFAPGDAPLSAVEPAPVSSVPVTS